jgi:hypothetical protein
LIHHTVVAENSEVINIHHSNNITEACKIKLNSVVSVQLTAGSEVNSQLTLKVVTKRTADDSSLLGCYAVSLGKQVLTCQKTTVVPSPDLEYGDSKLHHTFGDYTQIDKASDFGRF